MNCDKATKQVLADAINQRLETLKEEHSPEYRGNRFLADSDLQSASAESYSFDKKTIYDMFKVASEHFTGLINWGNQAFSDTQTLVDSLVDGLGVSPTVAKRMAVEYREFKTATQQVIDTQYKEGKQSSWLLPLGLVSSDTNGTIEIPNEILFNVFLASQAHYSSLQARGLANSVQKSLFLYSDPQVELSASEYKALNPLGTILNEYIVSLGNDITSSFNLKAVDPDSKDYLTRLGYALAGVGVLAQEQQGKLIVHTSSLDLGDPNPEHNRRFEDGNSIRHIRLPEQNNEVTEEVIENQKQLREDTTDYEKALGIYVDTDTPSTEPIQRVQHKPRGAITALSNRAKKIIKTMQEIVWTKTKAFDVVMNLPVEVYELLAGVEAKDPDAIYHEEISSAMDSKNEEIRRIRKLIEEYEEAGILDKFYIRYKMMRQLRLMQSGPMNAQASKVIRHIMAPASHRYQVTEKNEGYVMLSILQHLNQDPDKSALLNVVKQNTNGKDVLIKGIATKWNEMIEDPLIKQAIKDYKAGNIDKAVTELHNSKYGSNMAVVAGIQALSEWTDWSKDKSKAWESTINYEIDGITNGYAIGLMQNPTPENTVKGFKQTGVYLNENMQHIVDGVADDAYMEVGAILQQYMSNAELMTQLNLSAQKSDTPPEVLKAIKLSTPTRVKALNRLMGSGLLPEAARKLAKDPFMVANYGAGIKKIIASLAKSLHTGIYKEVGELQTSYNLNKELLANPELTDAERESLTAAQNDVIQRTETLAESLSGIGLPQITFTGKDGNTKSENISYYAKSVTRTKQGLVGLLKTNRLHTLTFSSSAKKESSKKLFQTLKPTYEAAIKTKIGGLEEARNALLGGLELAFQAFDAEFKKAAEEYLESKGRSGKNPELYEQDIQNILNTPRESGGPIFTLKDLVPQFHNPLTGEKSFIDLVDLIRDNTSSKNVVEVSRKGTTNFTMRMDQISFEDAGVASYVRMIQSIDATILNSVLEQYPDVVPIYDAIILSPGELENGNSQIAEVHKALNDAFVEMNAKINIFGQTYQNMLTIEKALGVELRKTKKGPTLTTAIRDFSLIVDQKKNELIRNGLTANQYYSVDGSQESIDQAFKDQEELDKTNPLGSMQVDRSQAQYEEHITYNDLDQESQNLFDELVELSDKSEGHLQSVLDTIIKPFKDLGSVTLSAGWVNTITHGEYDVEANHIGVSISRFKPKSLTEMSPQEVYVHELVHAISETGLRANASIRNKLRHLRDEIKKDLPENAWEVFLPKDSDGNIIYKTDPATEIALAKEMYEYVFNNPKDDHGSEFLAYGLTNANLVKYLQGKKVGTADLNIRDNNIWGRLLNFFQQILNKLYRGGELDVSKELIAVAMKARAINEHQKGYLSGFNSLVHKGSKFMQMANNKITSISQDKLQQYVATHEENSPFFSKLGKTAAAHVYFFMSEDKATMQARSNFLAKFVRARPLVNAIRSFMTGVNTPAELRRTNIKVRNVDTAREETRVAYQANVNSHFKSDIERTDEHKTAETKTLLKTSFHSLSALDLDYKGQFDLLRDDAILEAEITKQYTKLGIDRSSRTADLLQGLGEYMSMGHTKVPNIYTNAWGIHRESKLDYQQLRALAALEALRHVPRYTKNLALEVIDAEQATENIDNGIINLLMLHAAHEIESLQDLFGGNRWLMQDGFTTQITDNLVDMQVTSNSKVKDKLIKEGYEEVALTDNLDITLPDATILIHRNSPEVIRVQGFFSIQDKHHKGTTIGEITARDQIEQFGEIIDGKIIHKKVKSVIAQQKVAKKDGSRKLIPIRNEKGAIVDMRYQMPHSMIENLLSQDLKSDNVVGHMYDQLVAKVATRQENSKGVQLIYRDTKANMKGREGWYVDILDPEYSATTFDILPYDAQQEILALSQNGKFHVREDMLRAAFGYKMGSLASKIPQYAKQVRLAEHIWQKITSNAAVNIIIKTPKVIFTNLAENLFTLNMKNIPVTYALPKMVEGLKEVERYRTEAKEASQLHITLKTHRVPKSDSRWKRFQKLKNSLAANPVAPLINNGFFMAIAEDLDSTNEQGYLKRIEKKWEKSAVAEHTPQLLQNIIKEAFMTESTDTHKALRRAVQVSDFISRYALYEYRKEQGNTNKLDLIHEIDQTFINYNVPMLKSLQYLDSVGATQFSRFWLRSHRVALRLLRENPANLATGYAIEQITGVEHVGIFNDTAWGGDFMPLYNRMDDVLFEAFDAQGIELAEAIL